MEAFLSAKVLWMAGLRSFGLSATVVSIILISIMRFLWYTADRIWVPENGTPQLMQDVLYIVLAWNSYSTWREPLCKAQKSMVRIGAITLRGLIKLDLYQLCLLVMVLLVGISTFSKSPLIGGETCVQIAFAILRYTFLLMI